MKNIKSITLEEVVMKIATRLINIPLVEFNERIQEALEMIGTFLDIDRVYVFDYDLENYLTSNTFEWCKEGVEPQIEYLQNVSISELSDDWVKSHKEGEMVIHEDVMALDKNSRVYEILAPQGILSICTVPLTYENQCFGFVGFDDIRYTRSWSDQDIKLLKVIAEMLINAIIKQKNDLLVIELKEKAQKASEAKSTFLAQMSHEIRTPLNGIYNAFYLLSQFIIDDSYKNYVDIAQTSLDSLSSIVNNILDLSKIEANKMDLNLSFVDIEHEIVKTVRTIRPTIKAKGLVCDFSFDYSLNKEVLLDIRKVNQILLNLINNAVKFTDSGFIKTSMKRSSLNDAEYLLLTIEDSGIGMSEEDKSMILESFYQAKNNDRNGTGLGIPIINELINLMNGKLVINSQLGVGSKFEVYIPLIEKETIDFKFKDKNFLLLGKRINELNKMNIKISSFNKTSVGLPLVKNKFDVVIFENEIADSDVFNDIYNDYLTNTTIKVLATDTPTKNSFVDITIEHPFSRKMIDDALFKYLHKDETTTKKEKYIGEVLIVDDNEINRDALSAILLMHGVNSHCATSGMNAIELCKKEKYDLILMDIQMPHMNGYEASIEIKKIDLNNKTPIIALTANVFLSSNDIKMTNSISDILYKPIQVEQLLTMLSKYLRSNTVIEIPKNLLVFNKHNFEYLFDQSMNAGMVLVKEFIQTYLNDLRDLKVLIDSDNFKAIYEKFHYIKGSLSYLSAERLIFIIEYLMKESKLLNRISNDYYDLLVSEFNYLVNEIKKL